MSESHPPDWMLATFEQGRFQVIHDLLTDYEKHINAADGVVDREDYLKQCHSDSERDIMSQEMDYLEELRKNPIKFVGGYLVDKTVAVGGFGIVSLGFDQMGNPVAIKVPHFSWHIAKDRDELDKEVMILRDLDHPNIVKLIDSGYDDEWYLITEWVDGYNLKEAIEKIRAPLDQWLCIISQVCDALSFGHDLGIIHRDITPRNIMVTGETQPIVKVLDYGVAKRSTTTHSKSEHVKGTRKYIAPEQYDGRCDERSDIYSLGVVMSEIVHAQYSSPGRIPRPLTRVIDKATSKNPVRRFQTAQQFKNAIQAISQGISLGEIRIVHHINRFPRRLALGIVAICMLIASLLYWPGSSPLDEAAETSNESPTTISSGDRESIAVEPPRSLKDCFDQNGHPRISLESIPPGAQLSLFALKDIEPGASTGVLLGQTPIRSTVPPGDYLVVAQWPDGSWTEVLRRFPNSKTQGVLPNSPFDAFTRDGGSLRFAPIAKSKISNNGMVSRDGLWIDESIVQIHSNQVTSCGFRHACKVLEQQGKRLPFASELNDYFQNSEVHSSVDEWTCSYVSEREIAKTLKCGRDIYVQYSNFLVVPASEGANAYPLADYIGRKHHVGFRGVRSSIPFGKPGE